jgi:hypothetical protein
VESNLSKNFVMHVLRALHGEKIAIFFHELMGAHWINVEHCGEKKME